VPSTDRWREVPVEPRRQTKLGASFRPPQVDALGLDVGWARDGNFELDAYVFWGAEYWIARQQSGDARYLDAIARIMSES
jgi:hypothetical protein